MAVVVPTINAPDINEYKAMVERVTPFAKRLHIDVCDGKFADGHTPGLAQMFTPLDVAVDLHLMLQDPEDQFHSAVSIKPYMVIFHVESNGNVLDLIKQTKLLGIKAGVAILPSTQITTAAEAIKAADHVLIFTGHLGHNGGEFQENQLNKVAGIRKLNPAAEISVDGGVNTANASMIAAAGVDVLYTGAFIQESKNPLKTYHLLESVAVTQGEVK